MNTPNHATLESDVLRLIAQNPAGLGMDALCAAFPSVPRRTLQRRMATLAQAQGVVLQGKGRGARYVLATTSAPAVPQPVAPMLAREPGADYPTDAYVPTSPEGEAIKAYVRQPRHLRKPVGYQQAFLEAYVPNVTAYLPPELRAQLHTLGQSPAAQTPAGTFARDILNRLLIDLSWASSRLEGNTYSRLDTERLIAQGQVAEGKDAVETQMILNHKEAIEYLVHDPERASLTPDTVIALHAFLSNGLMADAMAVGRLRQRAVGIGGSVYLPLASPQGIQDIFGFVLEMAAEITDPFEQAFFLMVHLPYLQPFEDVNKRVSRLAANIPFIRHNLCPLSFIDMPQQAYVDAMLGVYELNQVELLRDVFVWAYGRSCQQYVAVQQNMGKPNMFRMRYRRELSDVVAAMVRALEPATEEAVHRRLPVQVTQADQAGFKALVLVELKALHAGNAVRFGLRPLEVEGWMAHTTPTKL
ncbi:cell filamentation protein Fic [Rhodoferax sp. TH121]|uniref:Fic family protein n=1 Tax=Rhodoferax sp. TH121 TaxID=2022803 RepID=UPI000B969F87|nr:Fic family protein [Rhodoferax sp. TH121]OYQ42388.1 cell filamentation protein Fic [Rhodoferax sp. TH121]